jgi:lipid A 4'-phosphatase
MKKLLFLGGVVVAGLLFWAFPGIDLWATGLFWRQDKGFYARDFLPFHLVHEGMPYLTAVIGVGLIAFALWASWQRRGRRVAIYLLLSLIVGPGLVVNTALKDNWGRARPSQVMEFGGTKSFTPAPLPAGQCSKNCSFVAGDPAMGFWFLSLAFLLPPPRRWLAEAGAVALGAFFGLARIAQGGHFLSDVIFCGFAVAATAWLLHWLIVEDGAGFSAPGRSRGSPRAAR